jgi:hypothetical protein
MKTTSYLFGVSICLASVVALAQHGGHAAPAPHRAPPARGPTAWKAPEAHARPEVRVPVYRPEKPAPHTERPHVDEKDRWVGHETGPEDRRYHVVHPWPAGRFGGQIGAGHLYRLNGWDVARHRFWFTGSYWGIASWDWEYVEDWDWANDQVVIYDDPDHEGWYLAYNERLGTYVHVQYDGPQS